MVNVCYYIGLLINIILREKGLWKKGEDRKGLILRQHNNQEKIMNFERRLFIFELTTLNDYQMSI